jgi:hypothetical protein
MSFVLQVSFTGLCLYLVQEDRKRLAVLQPDCRPDPADDEYFVHPDGTRGARHAGYLRWDLANYVAAVAPGEVIPPRPADPRYEVIHRFTKQEVKFDLPAATGTITGDLALPRFAEIANERNPADTAQPLPLLEPVPHLFSTVVDEVPRPLLMRLMLEDGELAATGSETWRFPRLFRRGKPGEYVGSFRSMATWTRKVDADELKITIADFDGGNAAVIRLKPVTNGGVIALKIANLCSENPLEWRELNRRLVTEDDEDFKWLYRLLQPTLGREYDDVLLGYALPIPLKPVVGGAAGVEDCLGGVLGLKTIP